MKKTKKTIDWSQVDIAVKVAPVACEWMLEVGKRYSADAIAKAALKLADAILTGAKR